MSKESSPTSSSTKPRGARFPGDPDCPICNGVGYIRQDLPIDHPDFGRLTMCVCLQRTALESEHDRRYQVSNLVAFKGKTFDSFVPKGQFGIDPREAASLESAYRVAQQYAGNLEGWLLLMGGYGSGKTHLAAAIANAAVSRGVETLFLTVPDLLDWLRASYDSPDARFEERFDEIRNVRLLVLDDLGAQNPSLWAGEKLFQILNHRYVLQLPTVLTTNLELGEIDGRISSRLMDSTLVVKVWILAPDYRRMDNTVGASVRTDLSLLSRMTFGSWQARELEKLEPDERGSLEKALRTAELYAKNPRGWLVISGGYFSGKTHLAAAIGNAHFLQGERVSFWVVAELLDHLRATFSPTSTVTYDHLFEEVKTAPLLILDDFGGQSTTAWAQEKLYQILNFRYNAELPTVITTLKTLDEIEPRIRSRFLDRSRCTFLAITAPAYGMGVNSPAARARVKKPRSI